MSSQRRGLSSSANVTGRYVNANTADSKPDDPIDQYAQTHRYTHRIAHKHGYPYPFARCQPYAPGNVNAGQRHARAGR